MNTGNISIKASVSGNTPGLKGEKGNGIKSTVLNDDYSLTFNYTNGTSDTTPPIRGQKGEKGDNGISPSITTSKSGKVTTITIKDATGTKVASINDGVDSQGDMLKSTYDKNSNGIVDNSEKVNGHTVESNVPANAKFTDTIYSHPINSGNKHIPSGGSSGQILKWEEDGTAKWDDSIEAHREGTELKVNNYKQLIKFTKEGKTEQKSYTGKNILDYVSNLKASSDGLNSTINSDGSITTSGKPSSNYRTILNSINIIDFLEDGETYTFSQSKANDKLYMQMNAKKKDGTYSYYSLNDSTKSKQEIIVNKSIYETYTLNIQTGLTSDWGDSSLTITNKYMLCKGTDTVAISFEPYVGGQASPNPDYPQEIKNIKGVENIWFGRESTTNNGITFTKNADGSYDITGTATAQADCINLVNIANAKLKNGINYNLSINKLTNEKVSILTEAYIENWDSHVIGPLITSTTLSTNKIINIKDNITRVRYVIRVEKGQTVNIKGLKIQLEEGTIAHTFVLPGSNYLQLEDKTENLIGLDNKQYSVNLKKGDKIFAVNNGTTNLNLNLYTNYGDTARNDFFTIAANSQRLIVIANDSHAIAWGGTLDNLAWVVKGEKFIPYEPYQKKIMNIDLKGNNLCSDRDKTIRDELVIENVKAKINKKFGEYIFTGNENFSFADSNTRIKIDSNLLPQLANVYIPQPKTSSNRTPSFCTHYILSSQDNIVKGSNKFAFSQWSNQKFIYFPADYSTIEEFKAKLKSLYDSGNPVKVQYQLAEPKVIDLGEIDFDLIENSTLTCEEESDMQIDYLTISSNIFVQDSLDGSSSQKAPSVDAVNEIISKLEARIIALENKNV